MTPDSRRHEGARPRPGGRAVGSGARGGPTGRGTRLFLLVAGTAALGLGIAGAFLPGVPTTPFLLVAAYCYARSSDRMYRWLLGHRRLGPPIRRLLAGKGLPLRAKVWSLAVAYAVLGLTAAFWMREGWGRMLLLVLAVLKTYYLMLRLPTARD